MKTKISYGCRRLLVTISVFSLLFTSFASALIGSLNVSAASRYNADDSWQNSGIGTAAEPYLIGTAEQLYSIASDKTGRLSAGKCFKLTNDIYLNETDGDSWYNSLNNRQWVSSFVSADQGFCGTFDGNGYTVYGLYYSKDYSNDDAKADTGGSDNFFAGLFPRISEGAVVKNLIIRKANVDLSGLTLSSDMYIGGIAGYSDGNIAFDRCYVGEDVTVKGAFVGGILGGYGGSGRTVTFNSIAFTGQITQCNHWDTIRWGGFVGNVWAGTAVVNDSFTTAARVGFVTWSGSRGEGSNIYAVGEGDYGFANGCVTVVSADKMKGEAAKANMPGLNWDSVWKTTDSGYPVIHLERKQAFPVWNGTADDSWQNTALGTAEDPYIITTAEQLYSIASDKTGRLSAGKYFRLDNNIYLNNTEGAEWYNNSDNRQWVSSFVSADQGFCGTFDGNGYTVYGLYYSKSYTNDDAKADTGGSDDFFAGLFPRISEGAVVKNLIIRKANVDLSGLTLSNDMYIGGIAGYSDGNITFEKCYVGEDVTVKGAFVGGILGGYGGSGRTATFNSTAFTGQITQCNHWDAIRWGGFVGNVWAGTAVVNDSFTTAARVGFVTWSGSRGEGSNIYAVGEGDYGFANGCVTVISADKMKGEAAKTNMPGLDWENVWVTKENGYPELYFESKDSSGVWDGTADKSWLNTGSGTSDSPYIISTAEQLYSIASNADGSATSGKYFKLANDIYLNKTDSDDWYDSLNNRQWVSSFVSADQGFCGTFDGNGYTVYGLYYSKSYTNDDAKADTGGSDNFFAGLFPRISEGAVVKNLIIRKANVDLSGLTLSSDMYIGGIAGYSDGNITFDRCYVGEDVTVKGAFVGGILGGYGGNGRTVTFNSTAFTGQITQCNHWDTIRWGGFVGNVWAGTAVVNDSFTTAARVGFVTWSGSRGEGSNIYAVGEGDYGFANGCVTVVSADKMKGEAAKANMPGLNWDGVWVTTETGYPELYFNRSSGDTIWNGGADISWKDNGSGTEADPYRISTAEQLFSVVRLDLNSSSGKYFELQNDIYLNDVGDDKWYNNSENKQWASFDANVQSKFGGIFNGNGYTVYGLYYDIKSVSGENLVCGLFPKIFYGAAVKNLNIDRAYINSDTSVTKEVYAAAIIGFTADSEITVSHCYVGRNVYINTVFAGGILGGMGAWSASNTVTIDSCAFVGSVAGSRYGGFAGNIWSGSVCVKNSFTAAKRAGFITWGGSSGYSENTYVAGKGGDEIQGTFKIEESDMIGEAAKQNMPQLSWGNIWVTNESDYPTFFTPDIWDGTGDDSWKNTAAGTENDPYIISTPEQLYSVASADYASTAGKYFKLVTDIYLNKVENKGWTSSVSTRQWITSIKSGDTSRFAGCFDGNSHTVYGLYYNIDKIPDSDIAAGLFPKASAGAVIKNLNISASHLYIAEILSGNVFAGAVIGYISEPDITVERCYIGTDVSVETDFAGGIIGGIGIPSSDTVKISSCAYLGTVKGERNGGFAGNVWSGKLEVTDSFTLAKRGAFITWSGSSGFADKTYVTENSDYDLSGLSVASPDNMTGKTVMYGGLKNLSWGVNWKTTNLYPVLSTADDIFGEAGRVWSGKMATWMAGAGTQKYPYIVDTPEKLYRMVAATETGAYYSITEDILLNDTGSTDWYKGGNLNEWVDNYTSTEFSAKVDSGKADGTLAEIKGIYKKNSKNHTAFIPNLGSSAVIRNIRISDSYISGTYNGLTGEHDGVAIGGIAANVVGRNCIIEGCIVEDTVILNTGWRIGGVVANVAGNVRIDNCAFKGQVKGGSEYSGGIVADSWGAAFVTHCYSIDQFIVNKFDVDNSRLELSYSNIDQYSSVHGPYTAENAIKLNKEYMKGLEALDKMKFLSKDIWTATENDYPDIVKKIELYDGKEGAVWSGKRAANYAGGSGTKADPYIIKTAEQLYKMLVESDNEYYFRLEADIILNNTSGKEWYAEIGVRPWIVNAGDGFRGHLDGNYHTVSGLYYDSDGLGQKNAVAVIPYATGGASVEKLGVTKAYISMENIYENYGAAIIGTIIRNSDKSVTVSRCFADNTVLINALCAGGIVGRADSGTSAMIDNCFFTGSIDGDTAYSGAMIGRLISAGSKIESSFAVTAESGRFIGGEYGTSRTDSNDGLISKSYYYGSYSTPGVDQIDYSERLGKQVEKRMKELDFDTVWLSVENGTPVLRGFVSPERFSDTGIRTTTIMFVTNASDITIEPITAEIESKLELPKPTRLGYRFDGWYVYEEFAVEFNETVMPLCDITLYAKWTPTSIIQDFEDYTNTEYDLGSDYQYYRPGATGYSAKYTHGGYKAIHRLGNTDDEQDFLINYKEPLTVGKKYRMYIWVCTDNDNASFTLSLVHNTWPDISDPIKGVEKMFDISGLKAGKWTEYSYTFTAGTEWVSIRSTGGASIYFDDIMLIEEGDGNIKNMNDSSGINNNAPKTGENITYVVLAAFILLISVGATVILYRRVKRNNK